MRAELMGPLATTLAAISMGAVYMGALTYIGNAPNFMVYAIAAERGVKMPSFFGYMLWSCAGPAAGLRAAHLSSWSQVLIADRCCFAASGRDQPRDSAERKRAASY